MSLTITDKVMRSTDTAHTAELLAEVEPGQEVWGVSWLPDQGLTRVQANAAMLIAESVGQIPADAGPEAYSGTFWNHVNVLAAELGLAGSVAVARVSEPPS